MGLFPYGGGFSIDGVFSDTWRMYYKDWGISIVPGLRASLVSVPGRVGKKNAGMEIDSRIVRMTVSCFNPSRQGMWANMMAFSAAVDPRVGTHKLILLDDNPTYYINVVPNSEVPAKPNLVVADFDIQFEAVDPHWYYMTPRSIPATAVSNSVGITVDNTNGSTTTPPKWTITRPSGTGTMTGVVLTYGGSTLTYNGTIAVGDVVVIDCDAYTITKNGVSDIANWGGDDFPLLAVGAAQPVTWHDTNAATGAQLAVTYNERNI